MDSSLIVVILILLAVVFAILTIEIEDVMYAILCFCLMCTFIGLFYFAVNVVYVGIFQLLIYAGAVIALAVAAVMLTSRREVRRSK